MMDYFHGMYCKGNLNPDFTDTKIVFVFTNTIENSFNKVGH